MRMAQAWLALADEQDWLEGEIPPLPLGQVPREVA
jgi:hypothetical protein